MVNLRFSSGSDECGRRLHEVSCGSDWYPGVVSVMAKICVVSDYVVKFEIQILFRLLSFNFTWFSWGSVVV